MEFTVDTVNLFVGLAALIAVVGGLAAFWRKWLRPKIEFVAELGEAARITLLGHPEVRDPGNPGKVIEPGRPGALDRLGSLEDAVTLLISSQAKFADHDKLLADHGRLLRDHDRSIALLNTQVLERLASHIDSAEGYRAIQAALTAQASDQGPDAAPSLEERDTDI